MGNFSSRISSFPCFLVKVMKHENPPPPPPPTHTHTHTNNLICLYTFRNFFFFLLSGFFCLSFPSLLLLFDILKPRNYPPDEVFGKFFNLRALRDSLRAFCLGAGLRPTTMRVRIVREEVLHRVVEANKGMLGSPLARCCYYVRVAMPAKVCCDFYLMVKFDLKFEISDGKIGNVPRATTTTESLIWCIIRCYI